MNIKEDIVTHQRKFGFAKGYCGWSGASARKEHLTALIALAFLACIALLPTTATAACNRQVSGDAIVDQRHGQFQLLAVNNDEDGDDASIVGLWHVYFASNGQPFDEGYDQWHSDGTEILNDTAPPQPANGAGTVCLGVYKKMGAGTYKLRHPFWIFDGQGNLAANGVLLEVVTMNKGGNAYHGTFAFITYDLNGNTTFQTTGDIKAQRITVDQ